VSNLGRRSLQCGGALGLNLVVMFESSCEVDYGFAFKRVTREPR